jgi:hypothetical protein
MSMRRASFPTATVISLVVQFKQASDASRRNFASSWKPTFAAVAIARSTLAFATSNRQKTTFAMAGELLNNERLIRLGMFLGILSLMSVWE